MKSKNGQIRWMRLFLEIHREEVNEEEFSERRFKWRRERGGEMEQGKGEKRRNGRKRKMADRRRAVASLFLFLSNKLLSICRPDPPPRAQKATQTRVRAHSVFPLHTQTQYYKHSPPQNTHILSVTHSPHTSD